MSRRDRSATTTNPGARRGKAGKVVLLPQGIELELVGIIGPAGGTAGVDAVETVLLEGDEDLRALVEGLCEAASDPAACGWNDCDGGIPPGDRPLN
jgi:hypothetical protein